MSAKSKNFQADDPARPFDKAVLEQAKRLASKYEIVMWFEEGEWYGHGLELPNVYGDGKTPQACIKSTREGFVAAVATMIEQGQKPPSPARIGERTEQVNIRLTAEEKALLESKSRARGFRGLSDFIRTSVLVEK